MIRPRRPVSAADVAAHYDDLDRFYRAIWGEHVHHGYWRRGDEDVAAATANLVDLVAERLGLPPGARVCDVGCGYGATARRLARRFGLEVTGVTLSRAQLAAASPPDGGPAPRLLLADWLRNGFADGAFDGVLAIESSEHMPDLARFFGEAFRVLAPGGRLVVCAWLAGDGARPWQRRHLLEPICREGRLAALGTAAEYLDLMREAGFAEARWTDISGAVSRTWTICLRRLAAALATDRSARRFLLDSAQSNRVFAATLLRIRAAYALGALRYGVFEGTRPVPR